MPSISIGVAQKVDQLRQRLDLEFKQLGGRGLEVRVEETIRGDYVFLDCHLSLAGDVAGVTHGLLRHHVANALSDLIVNKWEEMLIDRIVASGYDYFDTGERKVIAEHAAHRLHSSRSRRLGLKISFKGRIFNRLSEYLEHNDEIILDGFITFRLRDYLEELEDAVERAVDDFLLEREYREFIRLLKYFVEVQEPRVDRVNVLVQSSGAFRIVDNQGHPVDNEYLDEFLQENIDSEIDYADLLISALITIAPRELVVHRPDQMEEHALDTIYRVFGPRVITCQKCPLCTSVFNHGRRD